MYYDHHIKYSEWKYQQSCRNWTIYDWQMYGNEFNYLGYDFVEAERLKDIVSRVGSLRINEGACESLIFEPDYAEYSGEMDPEESLALIEMQEEYYKSLQLSKRLEQRKGYKYKYTNLRLRVPNLIKMKMRVRDEQKR